MALQQVQQPQHSAVVEMIWSHSVLCEEVYKVLLDENQILRGSGELIESGVLDRKKMLLGELNDSLQRMREASKAERAPQSAALKSVAAKAQRVLLKSMLLDKENEQLLLKHALSSSSGEVQIIPKPTAKQVRKRYESQN